MTSRKSTSSTFFKTPSHPRGTSSSDDESMNSSSDQESGGAKFFASRPSTSTLKKSKWLAYQGKATGSDSESEEESESELESESESEEESEEESDESESEKGKKKTGSSTPSTTTTTPSNRFLKTKPDQVKEKQDETSSEASEDESSDFSFLSDSEEETSEDSSEDEERPLEPEQRRSRWVKVSSTEAKPEEPKRAEPKPKVEKETKKVKPTAVMKETKLEKESKTKEAVAELLGEVTPFNVLSKLEGVMVARGKKGSDREVILLALQQLLSLASFSFQKIKLLFSLVSCHFDYPSASSNHLPVAQWKLAAGRITEILDLLNSNPSLTLNESIEEEADEATLIELLQKNQSKTDSIPLVLKCSLASQLERLDDEFIKSLQFQEGKSSDSRDRFRNEHLLYHILLRAEVYLRRIQHKDNLHRILLRRIEHMYFKKANVIEKLELSLHEKDASLLPTNFTFQHLCAYLYQHGDDRTRTRTMLCHVYHQALHDQFYQAKEMLLMSHVQTVIHQADIPTQALFNRALVQLGLCAFRLGLMRECYTFLHGLLNTSRASDLLGTGGASMSVELLEMVYLTASMLLEVPNLAGHPFDPTRRRILSKPFRRNYEALEKSAFVGPPENDLDCIMASAKALFKGDLITAHHHVCAMRTWKQFHQPESIHSMLLQQIKEVGLITWIYTSSLHSTSISLLYLSQHFNMTLQETTAILSKMIKNKEIQGYLDGVLDTFILTPPNTKLQWLSNQLADKLIHLSELHQKIYDNKQSARKTGPKNFNNPLKRGQKTY